MTARSRKALLTLLALTAILPFLPALTAPFLEWDDAINLTENPHWRGFTPANIRWMLTTMFGGPYQPLSWLSYAFDFTLWGENPAALRMTNYALHGFSSVLLFQIIEDLIREASPSSSPRERLIAALFSSLAWAVHPLRVESVVWLTERRDVLSGFFYLLAVRLYIRDREKPLRPLFAFCLAVLSKASVITLPLTLLALDRWPLRRSSWADKIPYFVISAVAGVVGLVGQQASGTLKGAEVGLGARLSLGVHSLWWYAAKTAWPSGLSPYHRVPDGFGLADPAVWAAALGVTALAGLAWAARRRSPAAPAAAAHYAIALLPLAGFVRFGHHLVAERYSYLPGLALSALAGAALLAARRRAGARAPASAAAVVLIMACAAMTARGSSYWSSTEALWRRASDVDPHATLPRTNLASHLRRSGRIEEALVQERLAVAEDPRLAEQINNLGANALEKKSCAQAEKLLRAAVAAKPSLATAHYNLALALGCLGRRAEERAELERAARLDFSNADILNNLGVALTSSGKPARAEAALRRAAELQPGRPVTYYNLGNALMAQGRHREAGDAFDAAARLDPRFVLAWINGGNAAARAGRLRGAEERYRKALEIAPRNEVARRNLAEVRRALRR
ncbi:MAG: tetratricopeptide repeat protein [Elusimicrobiota bacterium]